MHSNKKKWRSSGLVDYVRIESRPPRRAKNDHRCQMVLDWLPAGDSGAHDAFVALMEASLRQRSPAAARAFYTALHAFANGYLLQGEWVWYYNNS